MIQEIVKFEGVDLFRLQRNRVMGETGLTFDNLVPLDCRKYCDRLSLSNTQFSLFQNFAKTKHL